MAEPPARSARLSRKSPKGFCGAGTLWKSDCRLGVSCEIRSEDGDTLFPRGWSLMLVSISVEAMVEIFVVVALKFREEGCLISLRVHSFLVK